MFDHTREISVEKMLKGEKGVEVITPFYTHLNEKGEECGILVNRGWVPIDLYDLKLHYQSASVGEITGFLYRGDPKTKYTLPNMPMMMYYTRVDPYDISLVTQMKNRDEASQFMLMQIDTNDEYRQILPTVPNKKDLTEWTKISPARHEAYANMWKYLVFGGVFANTALWLYF